MSVPSILMNTPPPSRISAVRPLWAVEGGRVTISGAGFLASDELPEVRVGSLPARISTASDQTLSVIVPEGLDGGRASS